MLKNKRLIMIIVALALLLIPSMVIATDGEVNITSIEAISPESGVYAAGQQITIRIKLDKAVKGTMPKLNIFFGNDDIKSLCTISTIFSFNCSISSSYSLGSIMIDFFFASNFSKNSFLSIFILLPFLRPF